jgi:hypothetical protein
MLTTAESGCAAMAKRASRVTSNVPPTKGDVAGMASEGTAGSTAAGTGEICSPAATGGALGPRGAIPDMLGPSPLLEAAGSACPQQTANGNTQPRTARCQ